MNGWMGGWVDVKSRFKDWLQQSNTKPKNRSGQGTLSFVQS